MCTIAVCARNPLYADIINEKKMMLNLEFVEDRDNHQLDYAMSNIILYITQIII